MKTSRAFPLLAVVVALAAAVSLRADDGMWLVNNPPSAQLKERYGFEPSAAWLEHVQQASVRFNNGGSGSFASADGLIITNHHVGFDAIYKLSTRERDLLKHGYLARTRAEELPCVDLELNVLMAIEDVTARVNAAVQPGMSASEAVAARNAAKSAIEKESFDRTGLRSDIVILYQGAQYHLYRYKRYTDVRLVFAPEEQAAFFGGDPDNFEFPRFNLDVAIFRAYENGAPARVEHFLKWNPAGTQEGDLVFLTGHPGTTQRLITLAELEFARDVQAPLALRNLKSREVLLNSWGKRGAENARRALDGLRTIENSRKVWDGRIDGLLDPELIEAKRSEEQALRRFAQDRPELGAADAWDRIAAAQQVIATHGARASLLAGYNMNNAFSGAHPSKLFNAARKLVLAPEEFAKPNGERLREYRDSAKVELELALFSQEPIYEDLEELELAHFLTFLAMELGANDPVVQAALAGRPPAARAAEIIAGTKLKNIDFRRQLYAMTPAELAAETDPLIVLARTLAPASRSVRRLIEQQVETKEQAHARIAEVRYAKDGDRIAPDATFTLRISFGAVKGFTVGATEVPAYTEMRGKFERAEERGHVSPYDLPASWVEKKAALDLATPYNFVSTCYSIGGNSGSPVVNRAGEFIGIIFDGSIHTLVWNYAYTETQARSISVDVRAIIEAMRKIYDADALVNELLGKN